MYHTYVCVCTYICAWEFINSQICYTFKKKVWQNKKFNEWSFSCKFRAKLFSKSVKSILDINTR